MKALKSLAWFLGFCILILPVLSKLDAQSPHADMDLEIAPKVDPRAPRVVRLAPAPIYAQWWQEIAKCSGLPIRPQIDSVRFYSVNAPFFQATIDADTLTVIGEARPDDHELYLIVGLITDEALVKHEMLHFLLAWSGYRFKNFHPVEYFERCGIHRTGP